MQLNELGLNRYMFKAEQTDITRGAVDMSSDAYAVIQRSTSEAGNPPDPGASEVVTNTVIVSCLLQSSGGPDRVEIAQEVTSQTGVNPALLDTDSFTVYQNNIGQVLINKYGIFARRIQIAGQASGGPPVFEYSVTSTVPETVAREPLVISGRIDAGGSFQTVPPPTGVAAWTVNHPAVGVYEVVHNYNILAPSYYTVNITTFDAAPSFGTISSIGNNSFEVNIFDASLGVPVLADIEFMFLFSLLQL